VVDVLSGLSLHSLLEPNGRARALIRLLRARPPRFRLPFVAGSAWLSIRSHLGLDPGEALEQWLRRTLANHGIHTTADLYARMRCLPESIGLRDGRDLTAEQKSPYLAIVACDLSTETKVDFPRMAGLYWKDPDQVHPATFVRASAAVPFFFRPYRVSGIPRDDGAWQRWQELANYSEDIPAECIFVDGGIMSNFPIHLFHARALAAAPTFGVRLGTGRRKRHSIARPTQLMQAVIDSARHCLDYDFLTQNPDYRRLVACIDTGEHDWLDFDLSEEAKLDLFTRGVRAGFDFLVRFDWERYKRLRSQTPAGNGNPAARRAAASAIEMRLSAAAGE
jgi:NTE family protein